MEDFDALMIRVNNLYYGRGRIVMSPECSLATSRNMGSSSSDDASCSSTSSAGAAENPVFPSNQTQSQVLVVDSIVNIGEKTTNRRGQASGHGVEQKKSDFVTCGNGGRLKRALSDFIPDRVVRRASPDNFKGLMFDENGNVRNSMVAVNRKDFSKEEEEDTRLLPKDCEATIIHSVNGSLIQNPWVSGEINAKEKDREILNIQRQAVEKEPALIFRDMLDTWKTSRDFWRSGDKVERPVKESSLRMVDMESLVLDGIAKTYVDKTAGHTPRDVPNEPGKKLKKCVSKDACSERQVVEKEKECYTDPALGDVTVGKTIETQPTKVQSRAKKSCLVRSKAGGMSKSQGSLSTLIEEEDLRFAKGNLITTNKLVNLKQRLTASSSNPDFIPFHPCSQSDAFLARLKPAKSVHNLIGRFEKIQDLETFDGSFDLAYGNRPKTWKSAEMLTEKSTGNIKPLVKEIFIDNIDKSFSRQGKKSFQETFGSDIYHKTDEVCARPVFENERSRPWVTGGKSYPLPLFGFNDSDKGPIFVQKQQRLQEGTERRHNAQLLSQSNSQENSRRPDKKMRPRSLSSEPLSAAVFSNKIPSARKGDLISNPQIGSALSADILFLEYDDGSSLSLDSNYDNISYKENLERKCLSMCDLSSGHWGTSGHSFYRERFEKALSHSKVDLTTFDSSLVCWRSLQDLRRRFEVNSESVNEHSENNKKSERVQQAIIDGMTKYAEQKFGRKKAAPKGGKTRSTMDDYDIYLRSLKTKIKTSQDRLNVVLKQKREIDEKVKKAEADVEKQEQNFRDAEDEKKVAEREGRDPKLPSGFIIPQTVAGAGFANLVMKASAQLWEDKFMAMRAKKGGSEDQPEWLAKSKRSDKILVNVGKKGHKKEEEQKPAWSTNLKKAEPRRKVEAKHDDGGKQPAFATVSLRKTTKKEEDEEAATKKVDWKEMEKKTSSAGGSRRRRGGDDSD
eukprot:gene11511-21728_t